MRIRAIGAVLACCAGMLFGIVATLPLASSASLAGAVAPTPALTAGQSLGVGGQLLSANGQYRLIVQTDGNVVLYGAFGALWSTGTSGPNANLVLQADGNLVLYVGGRPMFQTATFHSGETLALGDDGNLVIYTSEHYPLWLTGPAPTNVLRAGWVAGPNSRLVAPGGAYSAVVQSDGNVVVYGPSGALFSTQTSGTGVQLVMQYDGNLVLYSGGHALFQTGTRGSDAQLVMQADGNLVLYAGGRALWSTGTVMSRTRLVAGDVLDVGGMLVSPSGSYRAVLQPDGLVVYGPSGVLWNSTSPFFAYFGPGGFHPAQRSSSLALGALGDLLIDTFPSPDYPNGAGYFVGGGSFSAPVPTTGDGTVSMVMQDDGNLVIYGFDQPLWSTRTGAFPLIPLSTPTLTSTATDSSITLHWTPAAADVRARVAIYGSPGVDPFGSVWHSGALLATVDGQSGEWEQSGLAPHSAYSYSAEVTDRYGRQVTSAGVTFGTTGGTTRVLGVDTVSGDTLRWVSCASETLCVATTDPSHIGGSSTGNRWAYLYNGTGWNRITTTLAPTLVSCAAGPLCVLSDGHQFSTFTGTTWSSPATLGDDSTITQLSCASASFCLATDTRGYYSVFDGTRWSTPNLSGSEEFQALQCASATFCEAISTGATTSFNGVSWSDTGIAGVQQMNPRTLSCRRGASSPTGCVVTDGSYYLSLGNNGTSWTAFTDSQTRELEGLSCAVTRCVAVTTVGAVTLTGQLWSLPTTLGAVGMLVSVACPSDSLCIATTTAGQAIRFTP